MRKRTYSWGEHGLLAAILGVGLALRLWSITWGLPYVDHPDEPAVVNPTMAMLRRGDWQPHFFNYPSLYLYLLRAVFTLHWRWGLASGAYSPQSQLPETSDIYTSVPGFFVWGRLLTVAFALATIWLTYRIGRRRLGRAAGLIAAATLAVLPFHVRHSQYITTDVASGFTALLAVWAALRVLDAPSWRRYAVAGLAVGLAAGTKYNVALVAGAVVTAHALVWRGRSLREIGRLLLAGLGSAGGFLLTTPTIIPHFAEFTRDMQRQLASYSGGHGDAVGRWPLGEYLSFLWWDGLRVVPLLAALAGLAWIVRRQRAGLVMLGFALPYGLFVLGQQTHFFRNLLPLFPLLALWSAAGVQAAAGWLSQRRTGWRVRLVAGALAGLVLTYPLAKAVEISSFEAQPNSKVLADDFIRDGLPRGLPVMAEVNPVRWGGSPSVLPSADLAAHDAAWYQARGVRYIVVNQYNRRRDEQSAYAALTAGATLVRHFAGDEQGQPGPEISVYDLGFDPGQLAMTRRPAEFGAGLRLLGYAWAAGEPRPTIAPIEPAGELRSGQPLRLNLYWQVRQPLDRDYSLFVHVLDAQGQTVAQRDSVIRQGDYPTSRWQPGEIVLDTPDLPLPALPPGRYSLKIGLYDLETFARLPVGGSDAATADSALILLDLDIRP
jgi:4-amino-4-deoxy-L-arabinose transferase-like glycosyltransferase